MSKIIDQRIVEMSFENQKFERGIQQSKNSLREFTNALKGLDGANGSMSGLSTGVQTVTRQFSAFEQMAIGALRMTGAQAVLAGGQLVKSLSLDQVTAGLAKYEEKIAAVQTMVSARYGLEEVEKTMSQLMWFSDETSYSFSDMAQNMGKFVSAGVKLDTASRAMQGIATWAAHSGKNSQAASIAMFNLSQAISMGYVDTLNWRSIMNQNMNTVMFKQIAIGVAEATGAIKKGEVTIQDFDSNLKKKWFTNDVLLKTLEQYSMYAEKVKQVQSEMGFDTAKQAMDYMEEHADKYGDVLKTIGKAAFKAAQESKTFRDSIDATKDAVSTGWMKTYEIIFGTLEEAKANFSHLTEILWEVFASRGERRNNLLRELKELGGISDVFKSIKNSAVALLRPIAAISAGVDRIFPPKTAAQWKVITSSIKLFTEKLIISDSTSEKITRTFAGLFAAVDLGWSAFKVLAGAALEMVGAFLPIGDGILSTTASIGDLLVAINRAVKGSGAFNVAAFALKVAVAAIGLQIKKAVGWIGSLATAIKNSGNPFEFLRKITLGTLDLMLREIKMVLSSIDQVVGGGLGKLREMIEGMAPGKAKDFLLKFLDAIVLVVNVISKEAVGAFESFSKTINGINFNKVATFVTAGVFLMFVQQLTDLSKAMTTFVTNSGTFVSNLNKRMLGSTTKIKDYAYAIGVLTASIFLLSKIPADDLKRSLIGLAAGVGVFVAAYASIQAVGVAATKWLGGAKMAESAFELVGLAGALATMAYALRKVSKIDQKVVWNSVAVMGAMLGFIAAYQLFYAYLQTVPNLKVVDLQFGGMVVGILGLTLALHTLSKISHKDVSHGLLKVGEILILIGSIEALFSFVYRRFNKNPMNGITGIAGSILLITGAIMALDHIKQETIHRNITKLLRLSLILGAIEVVMGFSARLAGGNKLQSNMLRMGIGMAAMIAMIAVIDQIDNDAVDRGILAIAKMGAIISGIEIATGLAARLSAGAKLQRVLGGVTLTMVAMTGLIVVLGDPRIQDNVGSGIKNIVKISALVTALQLAFSAISLINPTGSSVKTLMAITGVIFSLTAALAVLSIQDAESLEGASKALSVSAAAIAAMTVGITLVVKSLSGLSAGASILSTIKSIGPVFAILASVFAAAGAFILAVNALSGPLESMEWSSIGKFSIMMGLVSSLLIVLGNTPILVAATSLPGLIPALGVVASVFLASIPMFAALKAVGPTLEDISPSTMAKFSATIAGTAIFLASMSLLAPPLVALSAVPFAALGVGALKAIAVAGAIVLAMTGLAFVLGKLISDASVIQNGIEVAALAASGIGRVIAAPIAGVGVELLTGIGLAISGFANALGRFDPGSAEGIRALAQAMLFISAASFITALQTILTLGAFGDPIAKFAGQTEKIMDVFSRVQVGNVKLASENMKVLSDTIVRYLAPLIKVASKIPNTGGLAAVFAGDNDLGEFGDKISKFVRSISSGTTPEIMKSAMTMLQHVASGMPYLARIAKVAGTIPNSGWMAGLFAGNNDIDKFGEKLRRFTHALGGGDVSIDEVKKSQSVMIEIAEIASKLKVVAMAAEKIPNSGWMAGLFAGNNDIDKFAEQISGFIKNISASTPEEARAATQIVQSLAPMVRALEGIANSSSMLPNAQTLGRSALASLGAEVRKFVETVSELDLGVVDPALKAVVRIHKVMMEFGGKTVEAAKRGFLDGRTTLRSAVEQMLESVRKAVEGKKRPIADAFTSIFSTSVKESRVYVGEFRKLGSEMVAGLNKGVLSGRATTTRSITSMSKNLIDTTASQLDIHSPSRIFMGIGEWIPKSIAIGVERGSDAASNSGIKMAEELESSIRDTMDIHSYSPEYGGIGGWVTKSIGTGAEKGINWLKKKGQEVGVAMNTATVEGIVSSAAGNASAVTDSLYSTIEALKGDAGVQEEAKAAGVSTGGRIASGIASGISGGKSKSSIKESAKAVSKSILEALQESLDERRFYGQLSLREELSSYEKMRDRYKKGSEERKKIDREIYRLTKEYYEAQKVYIDDLTKAREEASAKRSEIEKRYSDDVLRAQKEASERLSELRKKRDSDVASARDAAAKREEDREKRHQEEISRIQARAEADRLRAMEDKANRQKQINDKLISDIAAANKAYDDAIKSRADQIRSSYNLFQKVEPPKEPIKGKDLLENLRGQGAALQEWKDSLDKLSGRGVGKELIEELQKLGPASKDQIKALLELTDEELKEYVSLFKGKYTFARQKAEQELIGLKDKTSEIIKDLKEQSKKDLEGLDVEFGKTMSNINKRTSEELSALKEQFDKDISEIRSELSSRLSEIERSFSESSAQVNEDLAKKMADMKKSYNEGMTQVNSDLQAKLSDLKEKFSGTMREVRGLTEKQMKELIKENRSKMQTMNSETEQELQKAQQQFSSAGTGMVAKLGQGLRGLAVTAVNAVRGSNYQTRSELDRGSGDFNRSGWNAAKGFAAGIEAGTHMPVRAAAAMAAKAVDAANSRLKINSPSKVFMETGASVNEGLALGIKKTSWMAEGAAGSVAGSTVSAMSRALAEVATLADGEWNIQPTITPVLDLSNVRRQDLSGILGYGVTTGISPRRDAVLDNQNGAGGNVIINNNFDVSGLTIREEADIDKVAAGLYARQQAAMRGQGIRIVNRGRM